MTSKKKSFWLSYDLGLRGNYSGLYNFLDNWNAIECGNNLAYFVYVNPNLLETDKVIEKVKSELKELINPAEKDRIYIIWNENNRVTGSFLFGGRKQAPWFGYADKASVDYDNEEAI